MSGNPGHDRVEIMQRLGFGRGWPADNDDFDLERARRLDLGVSRVTAAVLGHQRLNTLAFHESKFISERERTARKYKLAAGQGVDIRGPVYRSHDVAMLRRSREGGELQATLSEENRLPLSPKSRDGVVHGCDLDPAVARLARPRRPAEDDERGTGRAAGGDRVGRDARSERMGRVDYGVDVLAGEKRRQAFGAAKAADALGNWPVSRIGRGPRERHDRRNIGLVSKPARKRAGFRRAAENEQANALQWAAP